jgi:glutaminyl-peptide cyclotransferase
MITKIFSKIVSAGRKSVSALLACSLLFTACNNGNNEDDSSDDDDAFIPAPVNLSFQVINQFRHDTSAFTEGLSFFNGTLYESTGSPDSPQTSSGTWIASIDLPTGKYERKVDLGRKYFGEGITFLNGKVYQLTYKEKKGFVYDARTFKKLREFTYQSEGWGLTNDGTNLIMSTGGSNLYYLNPDSLNFIRMLAVQDNRGYTSNLNELEFIDGFIYANEWLTGNILKIDPATGFVVGKFDLSKQVNEVKIKYPAAEEMNGIAHDTATKKTYITGKKWPVIYEIRW